MRILYFGDSHLTCVWQAAKDAETAPDGMEETFFAATLPHLRKNRFSISDDRLEPSHPKIRETFQLTGGAETIDLKAFDVCVVVSYATTAMHILRLISAKRAYLPADLYSPDNFYDYLMSDAVYRAFLSQGLENYDATQAIFGPYFEGRMAYVQRPMMSEDLPQHSSAARPDAVALKQRFYNDLHALFREKIGANGGLFVGQPEATLNPDRSTKRVHSLGSQKLIGEDDHHDRDFAHMNKEFGQLVLNDVRAALAENFAG